MPKVTEAHLEARKKQIMDAAGACFSRKGFHQTTMADICSQSKLSPGAVYSYYKSKEDIIMESAHGEMESNLDILAEINKRESGREKLNAMADTFFEHLVDHEKCFTIKIELWGEAMRNRNIMRMHKKSFDFYIGAIKDIIKQAQKDGEIDKKLDAETVSRVMIAMFEGMLVQKGLGQKVNVEDYVKLIKKLMNGIFVNGHE